MGKQIIFGHLKHNELNLLFLNLFYFLHVIKIVLARFSNGLVLSKAYIFLIDTHHFWSIQKFQIVRIWCRFFSAKKLLHFYFFLSIIFTYYVMHEKKIVVIYQEKMLFFLEFLGSLKKVPKRLSFLKTSKMGLWWRLNFTDHR